MRHRPSRGRPPNHTADTLQPMLATIDHFLENEQFDEAVELLTNTDRRFPNRPEVLGRLLNLYLSMEDMEAYAELAERLLRLQPNEPSIALGLASAYLMTKRAALAYQHFSAFLKRWPTNAHAPEIQKQLGELGPLLDLIWIELALPGATDINALAEYDEIQGYFAKNDFQEAIRRSEKLLQRYPNFNALRNNLSIAYQNIGLSDRAIGLARQVLINEPDNIFALSNLIQFLIAANKLPEALPYIEHLRQLPTTDTLIATRQAEVFSYLGDDAGVLAVFAKVQKLKDRDSVPETSAFLFHLAAVAAYRSGRTRAARRRWEKALELDPEMELAAANLDDLDLPIDEREGPWPYTIDYWVPLSVVDEIIKTLDLESEPTDATLERSAQRILIRYPFLKSAIPQLLDRGDPHGRELALMLAVLAKTPELLNALRDFGLGTRGSCTLRTEAIRAVQQAGMMPSGFVRFWQGGTWRDTLIIGFEITDEAEAVKLPPKAQQCLDEGIKALNKGNNKAAEKHFLKALEVVPNHRIILNNLGATYNRLGRTQEAREIAEQLYIEHPNYLYARTNLAAYRIVDKRFAEAQALLTPLLALNQMHGSEFDALIGVQIQLEIAQGNLPAADSWLALWETISPDNSDILTFRLQWRMAGGKKQTKK